MSCRTDNLLICVLDLPPGCYVFQCIHFLSVCWSVFMITSYLSESFYVDRASPKEEDIEF